MRVIEVSRPGAPGVLRVADRPIPQAGPGEVLVAIKAAGVSHADVMQREGKYPPPPGASDILGLEASGVVEDVGEGVAQWKRGDEVCVLLNGGGYAEYVAVRAGQALPKPANWSFIEAASLPENMFTVYDNLFTRARFTAGESILVHGGTSGIGSTAIMLAKAFGASTILATAGSERKCEACRELGADVAINYKTADFVSGAHDATRGRGVDVVLDVVGGDYLARDVEALAPDGRIVLLSTARGTSAEIDLRRMLRKRATIVASSLRPRSAEQKAAIARKLLSDVWPRLAQRAAIRPAIDRVYPFSEAAEAHTRMEASEHIGKIILVV